MNDKKTVTLSIDKNLWVKFKQFQLGQLEQDKKVNLSKYLSELLKNDLRRAE